ncbi:MAG TPA: ATP-binding protein, partial [Methanoculleus sp.]|nr:ATP-binding protein [Methanoculleus sp.]
MLVLPVAAPGCHKIPSVRFDHLYAVFHFHSFPAALPCGRSKPPGARVAIVSRTLYETVYDGAHIPCVILCAACLIDRRPSRCRSLTLEKLRRAHASAPANPLLAEPMYLAGYIERMGTGTRDMIRRCIKAGLPEPEFTASGEFRTIIRRAPAPGQGPQPESQPLREETGGVREETGGAREETGGAREETGGAREETGGAREET